jgi:hypothetical protein
MMLSTCGMSKSISGDEIRVEFKSVRASAQAFRDEVQVFRDETRAEFKSQRHSIDMIAVQVAHNTVEISSLTKDVAGLHSKVDTISGNLILLENSVSGLTAVIREGLMPQVKTHQNRLDNHEGRISKLEGR